MKKTLVAVIAIFSMLAVSFGQKKLTEHTFEYDGTTKTPATINELDWLTGRWTGAGFGGWLEDTLDQSGGFTASPL